MELSNRVLENLEERRMNLINGKINSIPSAFQRCREDFIGFEQGTYYGITSFTKGKIYINLSI